MPNNNRPTCCAVIVAAGSGSRMGAMPQTKQFLYLAHEPVIYRTIRQFDLCPNVSSIVIVARENEIPLYDGFECSKPFFVVAGGSTRRDSVKNGIDAAPPDTEFVAIHDGARCLITPEMITRVLNAAFEHGAASAGCRAVDTLKTVSEDGCITSTPDRSLLWHAQTPQVSRLSVYRRAAEECPEVGVTDDNSLLEMAGVSIKMVDCGATNIKITSAEDLCIGEALLKLRGDV